MAYRYTMVDYNTVDEVYDLRCYENDICVLYRSFGTESEALRYGDKFLNGELKLEVVEPHYD